MTLHMTASRSERLTPAFSSLAQLRTKSSLEAGEAALDSLRPTLARIAQVRKFAHSQVIDFGEHARHLVCFVSTGKVDSYVLTASGQSIFTGELLPGDLLGSVGPPEVQRDVSFFRAREETELLVLTRTALIELVSRSEELLIFVLEKLAAREQATLERYVQTSSMPMRTRLALELLRLAMPAEFGGWRIAPFPTHEELAIRIGSQREAVSRALRELLRSGVLRKEAGPRVFSCDVRRLRTFADS